MGVVQNVTHNGFPKQGDHLDKRVSVYFRYDTDNCIAGRIVRDDMEEPWETIIALDDGRYIRSVECQYIPEE